MARRSKFITASLVTLLVAFGIWSYYYQTPGLGGSALVQSPKTFISKLITKESKTNQSGWQRRN